MTLPIRILSTDFDGTLHTELEQPSVPLELQALIAGLQSRGVTWIINTGRDLASLSEVLGHADLSIKPDYVVTVEREIHVRMNGRFEGLAAWNMRCATEHKRLFSEIEGFLPDLIEWTRVTFPATTVYEDAYSPFCVIAKNNDQADAIQEQVEEFCRRVPGLSYVRNDVYARFSHTDYNKGSALAEIGRILGALPQHIIAAGDHLNDLPMLSNTYARWLVAPANAIDPVKDAVRRQNGYVSLQPHGNGLCRGLEFVLEQAGAMDGILNSRRSPDAGRGFATS